VKNEEMSKVRKEDKSKSDEEKELLCEVERKVE
jgi:hypothetical protein